MQTVTPSSEASVATIVFLTLGGLVVLGITAIAVWYTRYRKPNNLLPVREKSQFQTLPPTLLQRYFKGVGIQTTVEPVNRLGRPLKVDSRHLPLNLAQPYSSHQTTHKVKSNLDLYLERKGKTQERERQAGVAPKLSAHWPLQSLERPKPASYWVQVGREMAARRTWREKLQDKIGM